MTEAEWLAANNPCWMLDCLLASGKAIDRKLRLYACACCRRGWHLLLNPRSRQAVENAELIAESSPGNVEDLGRVRASARAVYQDETGHPNPPSLMVVYATYASAFDAARLISANFPSEVLAKPLRRKVRFSLDAWPIMNAERDRVFVTLLRDIFENNFRPVAVDPGWLTHTVVQFARCAYDDHAFDRLPILADALEEAGCTDAAILAHCRGPGPHVRGCWVVDLLLGKQ